MHALLLTVHQWLTWTINLDLFLECIRKLPVVMDKLGEDPLDLPSLPTNSLSCYFPYA